MSTDLQDMPTQHDPNTSPVGWYIGSYLLRFIDLDEDGHEDPEARFKAWENTIIVQADSLKEAYQKVEELAKQESEPFEGGRDRKPVQWKYEGITDLLPIYEDLEDGAEIMWCDHSPKKLKTLRSMVRSFDDFS